MYLLCQLDTFNPGYSMAVLHSVTDDNFSVNSIDEILATEDLDQPVDVWKAELADRIEEIVDRKRSSVQGRETSLMAYVRMLTAHYAEDEIRAKDVEIVASICKSIKTESSEKETILALKGSCPIIECV